jgi:murein DD-endopeptidase MepM/ murein hydrolase activator NlpD
MKFTHWPLDRIFITQRFGIRPKYYLAFDLAGHNGLDFRTIWPETPNGRRKVFAVMGGEVVEVMAKDQGGYGKFIKIKHAEGGQTMYAHLGLIKVQLHQIVAGGDYLGLTDNTGASSGAHLHFGYRPPHYDKNNGYKGYVDPFSFLPVTKPY